MLTALITSQPRALKPDDLDVLARWVALKVMVAECDIRDLAVTPADVRKGFKADQLVPSDFRICIGQCGVGGWECGYYRHAATVARVRWIRLPCERNQTVLMKNGGLGTLGFAADPFGNPHPKLCLVAYRLRPRDVLRCGDLFRG
jgi:hypothetical protein